MKKTNAPIADELAGMRDTRTKVGIGAWNFAPWRDNFISTAKGRNPAAAMALQRRVA